MPVESWVAIRTSCIASSCPTKIERARCGHSSRPFGRSYHSSACSLLHPFGWYSHATTLSTWNRACCFYCSERYSQTFLWVKRAYLLFIAFHRWIDIFNCSFIQIYSVDWLSHRCRIPGPMHGIICYGQYCSRCSPRCYHGIFWAFRFPDWVRMLNASLFIH